MRILIVAVVSALLLFLAFDWLKNPQPEPAIDRGSTTGMPQQAPSYGSEPARNVDSTSKPEHRQPYIDVPTPLPRIGESEYQSDLQKAQEAWAERVGMTTSPSEYNRLRQLDDSELKSLYAKGNLAAAEHLARRHFSRGDVDEGVQTLTEAVIDGSIGAAVYLGHRYLDGSEGFSRDKYFSYAWFNIARHMGDVGSVSMGSSLAYNMSEQDAVISEMLFLALLRDLNERSQLKHGRDLIFDPQPFNFQLPPREDPDKSN